MEVILLDEDSLRILLEVSEVKAIGPDLAAAERGALTAQELTESEREALFRLIEQAGKRCGRELSPERISVRLYCGRGGGEIYVTELRRQRERDALCLLPSAMAAARLSRALRSLGCDGIGCYLSAETGECYLRMTGRVPPISGEFGRVLPISGESALAWLKEHCICLPEGEEGKDEEYGRE